jgi:predicted nucleotidyltransferase
MTTKNLTKAGILKALRQHEAQLRDFSVRRIGLFGSFVRHAQRNGSDIDFLVEFNEPTYTNFYGLTVFLEKLLRRKVEILTPDAVDSIRVEEVAQSIKDSVVYV